MRKITSPKLANLEKEKCPELKFADGSVDHVEAIKRRDEAFSTTIGFSGLRCLRLGKIFSGEQIRLESVGRRHSGLLEKGTKDWPERTRRMQTLDISQSGRPDCDVAVGGSFSFLDLNGLQPGRVGLGGEESVGNSDADVQSPNPVMVSRGCRRVEMQKIPISDNCTSRFDDLLEWRDFVPSRTQREETWC